MNKKVRVFDKEEADAALKVGEIVALPIAERELAILERYALEHTSDELVAALPYKRVQQALTLAALRKYILEHGIDCPFDLNVEGIKRG